MYRCDISSLPLALKIAKMMIRSLEWHMAYHKQQKCVCCTVVQKCATWSDNPKYFMQFHPLGIVEVIFYRLTNDTYFRNEQVLSSAGPGF
jgi:hypothetical protein